MLTPELAEQLHRTGQGHLVDAVGRLDGDARRNLEQQVAALDLDQLHSLVNELVLSEPDADLGELEPPDVIAVPRTDGDLARDRHARLVGEETLREGRVAVVLVAGGQGTRLGFDGPKGDFPFAPITQRTLFAHHAAKIAAVRARYGCELPWYVMTSPQNDEATRRIFAANDWFGLDPGSVRMFVQGTQPAVDRVTGRVLLEAPDRIALSPDGHGGLFPALRRHGIYDELRASGITTIFTFQIDNPLVRIARPEFLGHHVNGGSEMSNVVVRKKSPDERMGILARSHGRTVLVEYSDLPDRVANARNRDGDLVFSAGSIAVHAIDLGFAERVSADGGGLPYHRALKTVPYVDDDGTIVRPDEPNAVKFEAFIFGALPLAERVLSIETFRYDEFSPIKNADGDDSPATARRDLNRLYARWLECAGAQVPRDGEGEPTVDIEIDPRYALDPAELADRLPEDFVVTGPTVIDADWGNGGRTAPT